MIKGFFGSIVIATLLTLAPGAFAQPDESLSRSQFADLFTRSVRLRDQMLADYRTTLEVYYELKKRSANPHEFPNVDYNPKLAEDFKSKLSPDLVRRYNQPAVGYVAEFNFALYQEFKNEFETDPRMKNNVFLHRLKEYGHGAANDVLQRVNMYAMEGFPVANQSAVVMSMIDATQDATNSALVEGREIFNEISKKHGYPKNRGMSDPQSLRQVRESYVLKMREFKKEMKALGYVDPETAAAKKRKAARAATKAEPTTAAIEPAAPAVEPVTDGAACAPDFKKISRKRRK